jgi:hypothetical protein
MVLVSPSRRDGFPARRLAGIATVTMWILTGCHPYGDQFQGEFNAGSVDPFNFPPAYRTTAAPTAVPSVTFTREVAGSGSFNASRALANGARADFFRFPFSPDRVQTTGFAAPTVGTLNLPAAPVQVFQFDPPPAIGASFEDSGACRAPTNYSFNPQRDDVRLDRQSNILSVLPTATFNQGAPPSWTYNPIVQRVTVTSNGEPCQDAKSDLTLLTRPDVTVTKGKPTAAGLPTAVGDANAFMAWAVVDAGSPILPTGVTAADPTKGVCTITSAACNGLGFQHFGWFRQFLGAYIDGGQIPLDGAAPTKMAAMNLYFPRSGAAAGNALGGGNDVVSGLRGVDPPCSATTAGNAATQPSCYSPVCQVFSYALPAATALPQSVAAIVGNPAIAASIQAGNTVTATGQITPTFVWCLQAR